MASYTLYWHPTLPHHLIVAFGNRLYLVPNIPAGWKQRKSYYAGMAGLETFDPKTGGDAIAGTLGIPEHGGPRADAGPHTLFDTPMSRVTVTLPDTLIATAKARGNGNLSAGLRLLIQDAQDTDKR